MKEKLRWKTWLKWIPVIVITVIAGIGLVKAPSKASDHLADDLKQEFAQNSEMLEKKDVAANAGQQPEDKLEDQRVTLVGDSVMLGAVPTLMEMMPDAIIDAKESRQVVQAVEILRALEEEDKLGGTVVIELGVNSRFSEATGQEVIDYLGDERKIYWVTVYGKYLPDQERINSVIMDLAKANDNLEVIRWDRKGEKNPDWFYNDGIHLNGAGRIGFAQVMCDALGIEPAHPEEGQPEEVNSQ